MQAEFPTTTFTQSQVGKKNPYKAARNWSRKKEITRNWSRVP